MKHFLQLHVLTSYPPSNLNRDDQGRPKTAIYGGSQRIRISSQSLKRAWRTSTVFADLVGGNVGTRTKRLGVGILESFLKAGIEVEQAVNWTRAIAEQFGKLKEKTFELGLASKKDKKGKDKKAKKGDAVEEASAPATTPEALAPFVEIEQLVHVGPSETKAIDALVTSLIKAKRAPKTEDLDLLRDNHEAVDIALFGRMLASKVRFNSEAAAQVAHAITVHKASVEDDYFTAVDDLNNRDEDAGSAHLGEVGFSSGAFYLYICVDRKLLLENLNGDKALADKALNALIECVAKVGPRGKQATFGTRAYASFVRAEIGDQQPRALTAAFLKPVNANSENSVVDAAIKSIETLATTMDSAYGACAEATYTLNAVAGSGTLNDLKTFATQD